MNQPQGNSVIQSILAGEAVGDILEAALRVDENELEEALSRADDQTCQDIRLWAASAVKHGKVESCLMNGGIFSVFLATEKGDDRKRLFEKLCKEVSVMSTQAYRCVAAWHRGGRSLLAEPELQKRMIVEALKMLCANSVPGKAFEDALELARGGTQIDIDQAKYLIARHSDEAQPEPAPADAPKSRSLKRKKRKKTNGSPSAETEEPLVKFNGASFIITLKRSKLSQLDPKAAIEDLFALIDQLKRNSFSQKIA